MWVGFLFPFFCVGRKKQNKFLQVCTDLSKS
jgi:hypothetical protein